MSTTRAQIIVQSQGTQGPPGIIWKGIHSASNSYVERDVVRDVSRNRLYIATRSVPVNQALPSGDGNSEYWDLFVFERELPPGLNWRGNYVLGDAYNTDDLVRDSNSNSLYVVIQDVVAGASYAITNTTFFELILEAIPLTDSEFATVESVAAGLSNISTVATANANISTVATDLSSGSSKITTVVDNLANIEVVSDDLNLGASSKIKQVSDNISDVTTLATAITDPNSSINQADEEATAAAASASAAATSAQAALASENQAAGYVNQAQGHSNSANTSAGTAASAATDATDAKEDAQKLAINAEDAQFTLSDGTTVGFSALHYHAKTEELANNINARFLGSYTESARPSSGVATGSIIYNSTTQKLEVWSGNSWQVGLQGPEGAAGPAGPGIVNIDYDSASDSLVITYQDVGLVQQGPAGVGISTITQPQGTSSALFTLTDATTQSVNLPVISAVDIAVNANNQLELTFNNGTTLTSTGTIVGPAGSNGSDGEDGAGIVAVEVNPNNTEQVRFELDTSPATYTSYFNLPKIIPTSAAINSSSQLEITLSNGDVLVTPQNVRGPAGADGADGADGVAGTDGSDGSDGISITNVDVVDASTIRFALSDGSYTGTITLPAGPQGPPGNDGLAGVPGADGSQGRGVSSLELLAPANGKYDLVARFSDDAANAAKTLIGQIDVPSNGTNGTNGKGWTAATYNSNTGIITLNSDHPELQLTTGDIRGPQGPQGDTISSITQPNSTTMRVAYGGTSTDLTLPSGPQGPAGPTGPAGPAGASFVNFFYSTFVRTGVRPFDDANVLDLGSTVAGSGISASFHNQKVFEYDAAGGTGNVAFPETAYYLITCSVGIRTTQSQDTETPFKIILKRSSSSVNVYSYFGVAPANQDPVTVSFVTTLYGLQNSAVYLAYDCAVDLEVFGGNGNEFGANFMFMKIVDAAYIGSVSF